MSNTTSTTAVATTTVVGLTPYAAAKIVNAVYEAAGSDKRIPTQMMYNYTTARVNAKKTPFIQVDKDGRIVAEDLHRWMVTYFGKQGIQVPAK